ncbi:unnamed protein product [Polarella glacialis]|uniref:Uncharacterized protein n=1 Tax=Polarella glacialis TaxID=89957 RepID=A0A813DFV8_POLGL|nr:unnamed protein product [Polarella glacialis]
MQYYFPFCDFYNVRKGPSNFRSANTFQASCWTATRKPKLDCTLFLLFVYGQFSITRPENLELVVVVCLFVFCLSGLFFRLSVVLLVFVYLFVVAGVVVVVVVVGVFVVVVVVAVVVVAAGVVAVYVHIWASAFLCASLFSFDGLQLFFPRSIHFRYWMLSRFVAALTIINF